MGLTDIPPKYSEIVNNAALKAGGLGVPGSFFPPLDILGMSYIWIRMVRNISKASGHKISAIYATKFVLSITSGAILYIGGSKLINSLLHAIPGAGTVTAASANAAFNWIYTLRLGKLLAKQFDQPSFDQGTLMTSAAGIAGLALAIPTADEMREAFDSIGHLLDWEPAGAASVADTTTTGSTVDLSTTGQPTSGSGSSAVAGSSEPRFAGGFQPVDAIADSQGNLPSCGLETLENIVQSANPAVSNDLSDLARSAGYQVPMPLDQYQYFLHTMGVASQWVPFDPATIHNTLLNAVSGSNTVALIGDPYYLNPELYQQPGGFHAVTLRDPWIVNGNTVGYIGIDSNCPGQPQQWTFDQVNQMSMQNQQGGSFAHKVLVTRTF